ncbi:metallophosphoesterase family protein [Phaeobacter sp. 11ANDIMAR09]|uniref:metallophosphoesterase family protein n=1 Tax=Phaeobacter sp. 11ANDIMAR09 TaxID=1225647 RepID=UPI0006C8938A|nr:metallophosphoesterase family protein [Phaeobacter sp. 11ANDIMAR09]KPD14266.1 serine/threonine protein phosphatase [Phaeobacter sp. 11ANDIMAR09]
MTQPIYAIGDIHGQLGMLEQALARIEADGGPEARVVFLGDYVDRGPDSRGVIELLSKGLDEGRNWTCLLGNHDRMFSMFMEDYPRNDARLLVGYHWLHDRIGGVETLQSYGVEVPEGIRIYELHAKARQAVPEEHCAFLNALPDYHQAGELLFVHAGIRPGVTLQDQSQDDKIWIRQEFLKDRTEHPWLVVHGHTQIPAPQHYGNRINLDSGAGFGRSLTTAVFEGKQCWVLADTGRVPLLPETA